MNLFLRISSVAKESQSEGYISNQVVIEISELFCDYIYLSIYLPMYMYIYIHTAKFDV